MTSSSHPRSFIFALPAVFVVLGLGGFPTPAPAQTLASQERMCDPTFEDCRADILTYISQETQQIDVGFWMMSDARYSNALVAARGRGVTVRVLMDPRCSGSHPSCVPPLDQMRTAGLPMRARKTGILHWKMILFASQGQVEFSGANYVPFELTPHEPWVNFTDEIVYFSNDPAVVRSMMTKFDDDWTNTTDYYDYANIDTPLTRSYPTYSIDPELNFPPHDSYRSRSVQAYDAEQQKIDILMFRITDLNHTWAMQRAVNRGLPVRLITDESEYRNPKRMWHAYNVDILHRSGVQVRLDAHLGINHAKGVILHGSGLSIFGSSNWTSPSSDTQREHNYFTVKPAILSWMKALFDRKWNNAAGHSETKPFVPLPPDPPQPYAPANAATAVPTTGVVLQWNAGIWAHIYDIYFGTTPDPPLLAANRELGHSNGRQFAIGAELQPGTTYYWKIVSKTMAHVPAEGPVWRFTTAGTPGPANNPPAASITSPSNGSSFAAPANIAISASASDTDGSVAKVDFYNGTTLLGSDPSAPYSFAWNGVGAGTYTITAVAHDDDGATTASAAVSVSVTGSSTTLPSGWSSGDVGATGAAGSASQSAGTFTVTGAGADVWGTADQFHYAYTSLTGDGTIVARVASTQFVHEWTKAGVMIRNSLSASAAQAFQLVAASSAKGVRFQRRPSDGASSINASGSLSTAPRWVKLVRAGSLVTGYESADGANWTVVGSDTFAMGPTVLIGLAISSHVSGTTATARFDNVSVTPASAPPPPPTNQPPSAALTSPSAGATFTAPATIALAASASDSDGTVARVDFYSGTTLLGTATSAPYQLSWSNVPAGTYSLTAVATDDDGASAASGSVSISVSPAQEAAGLPSGWAHRDVGDISIAGSVTHDNGVFTVTGSGADVWGTADAFHYAYRTMTGDGTIVARVTSVEQGIHSWVKGGVMIRAALTADSPHAFMLASAARGMAFQRRAVAGGISTNSAGTASAAPRWVKLQRNGNLFSAYESGDGVNWTLVGTESIEMGATVYVGLAVTSHNAGADATCAFDSVSIR